MLPAKFVVGQKHKPSDEASSRASWNTPRSSSRPGMSYGLRMALTFALTSLLTVIILVVVIMVVWGGAFSDYTRANVQDIADLVSQRLADEYEENGPWSTDTLAKVADSNMGSNDLGMQVLDSDGSILYDDTWPASAIAAQIKREQEASDDADSGSGTETAATTPSSRAASKSATHGLVSSAPTDKEGAVSKAVTLSDGKQVGTVRVWVLGSDVLLTKADSAFRENTFQAMFTAAAISIAISVVMGFLVARMLTIPISRITGTAKQIRDGDLSARTNLHGNDEIDQLGQTFDEMATSLEKDLKHERRLTSDVAHELRTPLMAMLATVEAMQDGVYPTDAEHLETVASETRRLARLVQQMLDLSRMENRSAPLNINQADIVSLVRNIVDSQEQLFASRDLHLRFADETQGRGLKAHIDADMITQAVVNIMSNAMRCTPEGGWVVVSVSGDRKTAQIVVSDTGIGIAKDDLSRIFGRFWRADASRAREAGGLGVGLAVTKQIVERHHGFISVDSELGRGTTFTIHLPREYTPDAPSTTMEH